MKINRFGKVVTIEPETEAEAEILYKKLKLSYRIFTEVMKAEDQKTS